MRYVIAILAALGVALLVAYIIRNSKLARRPENERSADAVIYQLKTANNEFHEKDIDGNGIKDFWTADVARLVYVMNLPPNIAAADPRSLALVPPRPIPYRGYLFVAMDTDDSGESPESLRQETDGKSGKVHHLTKFAFCAYPAEYRVSGIATYIINQDGARFSKDTKGQPVLRWPSVHTLQREYGKPGG